MSAPVRVVARIGHSGNALQSALHRIDIAEKLFPHRSKIDQVERLPGIFLRDLQLSHLGCLCHIVEDRCIRLARLEVKRSVLGLKDDIVVKQPVHGLELRHGLHHTVLAFVVGTIDKRAPDDRAAIGFQRVGEHVRTVGMASVIVSRSGLSLAVGLDEEAAEVRYQLIDLPSLTLPPSMHRSVEGIGRPGLVQS